MTELAGWDIDAGLIFGGRIGPIEPKDGEWISDERTKTKGNDVIPDNCNNLCFIIGSKEIERLIIKLKKDLEVLTKLGTDYIDLQGELGDWMSGVTLIRDDYFLQHAMSVAADQMVTASQAIDADQANLNSWPLKFINWDLAAEDLKKRYAPIDYNGVKYWIEKPI